MSDTKHTPGPWNFSPYFQSSKELEECLRLEIVPTRALTNEGQAFVMAASGRVALVDAQTEFKRGQAYKGECESRDANARLISAAPDLLEALKELDQYLDQILCYASTPDEYKPNAIVKAARAAIAKAEGRE